MQGSHRRNEAGVTLHTCAALPVLARQAELEARAGALSGEAPAPARTLEAPVELDATAANSSAVVRSCGVMSLCGVIGSVIGRFQFGRRRLKRLQEPRVPVLSNA